MRFSTTTLLAAAAATASAETIQVAVGQNGLTFTPNDVTAAVGSSVEFSFFPRNHTVTQSSFAKPCQPLAGGFFSTFQPTTLTPSAQTFTILINDTKPIWVYCSQPNNNHCQSGMVMAINAPTTGNTLAAYQALAKNATIPATSPPGQLLAGGILSVKSNSSSVSSSAVSQTTVTTSITTTVTALVTSGGSSYTTTYGTTYGTTYTTAVAASETPTGTGTGSGSGSSSSTTSAARSTGSSAAGKFAINGGIAGAAMVFAIGML